MGRKLDCSMDTFGGWTAFPVELFQRTPVDRGVLALATRHFVDGLGENVPIADDTGPEFDGPLPPDAAGCVASFPASNAEMAQRHCRRFPCSRRWRGRVMASSMARRFGRRASTGVTVSGRARPSTPRPVSSPRRSRRAACYARTRIDPSKGERWFCTETEARRFGSSTYSTSTRRRCRSFRINR